MGEWYEDWFGKDYLSLYSHRNQAEARRQIEFITREIPDAAFQNILDVACGSGRHLLELSKLLPNAKLFGIDLSAELLAEAKLTLAGESKCTLIRADMRQLPFENHSFSLVLSMFTSFGYFDSSEDNQRVAAEWFRVLTDDGYFVLDFLNSDLVSANLPTTSERDFGSMHVTERRILSGNGERVEKVIELHEKETDIKRSFKESVRLFSEKELSTLLTDVGFNIQSVFGDFDGSKRESSSPRCIILGSK